MVHLDIGVLDHKDDLIEAAFQRTVEFVAESVHRLRLPASNIRDLPNCAASRRVLVFGRESDQRAHHIAERNFFSHTVGSPNYDEPDAPGVFWVTDVSELEELEDETFDAVMIFNLSSSMSFINSFHHLQRLLKPGGVLAGTGVFQGFQRTKEGQSSLLGDIVDADLSLAEFRSLIEDNGFFVHVTMDLGLQGEIVLAVEEDSKRSEFHAELLNSVNLVCARFLASKTAGCVRKCPSMSPLSLASHNPTLSLSSLSPAPPALPPKDPVVVTGISLGLPNELRQECSVFDARNLERIFAGENFISQLTLDQKQRILDQNVVQVLKVDGQRVKRKLCKPTEVISLASRLGHFDLVKEYGVPPHVVETLDITYQLAIAAGLEACVSAGIPVLERTESKDNAGFVAKVHPLPENLQAETGVIFASSFPCTDSCVQEISLSSAHHTKRFLEECQALDVEKLRKAQANNEEYEFDRKLLFKLLVMANNQLAELIRARGPNTHVNAACASTSQAVAIAHDWLRLGRCRRVIVISADNTTNDNLLPYIGTGFLALTAASIAPTIQTGALPFDKRRNGMILGMGAVGMVLEMSSCALARSARPLAELVGSHFVNSAFHGSLLDREHISTELVTFIEKISKDQGVPASELARNLIYYSHETQTSAQGGCAKAEMDALSLAFGADAKPQILIANTKGFTGHPMGVGLEDVVAVASLDQGLCPPIANFKEKDPCLGDITLAQGGQHTRTYALRFSAGFGSQFVFLLFKKWSDACLQPCASPVALGDLDMLTTDGLFEELPAEVVVGVVGEAGEEYDSDADCSKPSKSISDNHDDESPMLRFRKHYSRGGAAILEPPKMVDDDEHDAHFQPVLHHQPLPPTHRELRRVAGIVPADVQDSCTLM